MAAMVVQFNTSRNSSIAWIFKAVAGYMESRLLNFCTQYNKEIQHCQWDESSTNKFYYIESGIRAVTTA